MEGESGKLSGPTVESVFNTALALPPVERAGYLAGACGGALQLRQRVEALLRAHEAPESFLPEQPGAGLANGATRLAKESLPVTAQSGDKIGRYKLLQKIGEGGCGVVYMAEQEEPVRRRVALKVIKLGMDTRQVIARFEAERQALAMMDHPNIAKVLDAGATETGRPYFVMELVRGIKITDHCDENNLSGTERLALFIQVCRAIQHAHQKGIIHRDIKPSNILVTLQDGVPVPKVIDFGIAKATQGRLTDQTLFTAFEQFMGTPAYMSPEQAELSSLDIDTRSDIYSLGVLLYELLTGQTPFDAKELLASGLEAMRRTVREKEPAPPSTRLSTMMKGELASAAQHRQTDPPKLIHSVRGDLDWIVMKCLEKDRTRRYETANGLARDIERHLNHEPITARPIGRAGKLWRWCRREPELSTLGGAILLLLLTLAIGSTVAAWRINTARSAERAERDLAEKARNQLALSVSEMEIREIHRAEEWFEAGESTKALSHLALVLRQDPSNYIAGQRLMSALSQRHFAHPVLPPLQHADRITWAQFSRDGRLIVTTSADATSRVWDAATGRPVARPFRHEQEINSADFSPDGQWLVTASMDTTARVWDIRTGEPLSPPLVHQGDICNAHFSPDGRWVVTASMDGTARVWEVGTGHPRFQPLRCDGAVFGAEFSPEGDRVLTASSDKTARIWDAVSGKPLVTFRHADLVRSARFSRDGQRIVTSSDDNTARVWDARTGQPICPVIEHGGEVGSAEFSPDGRWVATASRDRTARVWDARTGQPICPPLKHGDLVRSARFSPDGLRLVTTGWDKTARVWDARTGAAITEPLAHEAHVFWAEFHPDGQRVLTACNGTSAKVWGVGIAPAVPMVLNERGVLTSADFSFDGKRVVTCSDSGACIWDAELATPERTIISGTWVCFAAFSQDGRLLITAANNRAQIWDAHTGEPVGPSLNHSNRVYCARFSPDGRRILTASRDNTARVWDAHTGEPVTAPLRHQTRITDAQFSPDGLRVVTATGDEIESKTGFNAGGHRLVTALGDHSARIWDASTGQQLFLLQHESEVSSAEFSPDGQLVLTACHYTVQIWDAHTGQRRFPPLQHTDRVSLASFSSDGTRVLTGSGEGTVRIWEARTGKALASLGMRTMVDVYCAQLSPDGRRLLTALGVGGVRLWDVGTGLPLTEALKQPGEAVYAKFSPDERWVLTTANEGGGIFLWDVAMYPLPVPAWLPELAESLAGQRVDPLGRTEFVSCQNVLQIKQRLQQSSVRDAYQQWGRWFFAEDQPRPVSPNSHVMSPSPSTFAMATILFNEAAGNLTLTNTTHSVREMTGPTPGVGYDRFDLTGAVSLRNATLTISPAFGGPVRTFKAPPEGSLVSAGGLTFGVSYPDGDSRDVVLMVAHGKAYDPATDFSAVSNPNGAWRYGYSLTLGSQLILYTDTDLSGGLNHWLHDIASNTPNVYHNPATNSITWSTAHVPPGGFGLHPGPNGEFSIARLTPPVPGVYRVTGSFFGEDIVGTTTDVHILANNVPVFGGEVNGFGPGTGPSFDLVATLNSSDHLDFAVGYGTNNSHVNDSTGLTTEISLLVPLLHLQAASPGNVVVSWPSWASNLALQSTPEPTVMDSWRFVTNVPTATADWFYMTNSPVSRAQFYRLCRR